MSVDLDKIQGVIETEIVKATTGERKRVAALVTQFSKELIEAIKDGEESEAPSKPPAKKTKAKPDKAQKPPQKEEAEEDEDEDDYDISEVEDDEVEESEYNDKKVGELRAICKEREVTVPKGYGKKEIIKLLILVDEEQ